jgi:hypothetical protein
MEWRHRYDGKEYLNAFLPKRREKKRVSGYHISLYKKDTLLPVMKWTNMTGIQWQEAREGVWSYGHKRRYEGASILAEKNDSNQW